MRFLKTVSKAIFGFVLALIVLVIGVALVTPSNYQTANVKTETPAIRSASSKGQTSRRRVQNSGCLAYEPATVTLDGWTEEVTFPGRPNYESVENGDEPETVWILHLSEPVCTSQSHSDIDEEPESGIKEMELVFSREDDYRRYKPLLGQGVQATGTLFHGFTGHHHTAVLLTVSSLKAAGGQSPSNMIATVSTAFAPTVNKADVDNLVKSVFGVNASSFDKTLPDHFPDLGSLTDDEIKFMCSVDANHPDACFDKIKNRKTDKELVFLEIKKRLLSSTALFTLAGKIGTDWAERVGDDGSVADTAVKNVRKNLDAINKVGAMTPTLEADYHPESESYYAVVLRLTLDLHATSVLFARRIASATGDQRLMDSALRNEAWLPIATRSCIDRSVPYSPSDQPDCISTLGWSNSVKLGPAR